MRRPVESWVRRWWADEAGLSGSLASVAGFVPEIAYRSAVALRNRAYDRGWLRSPAAPLPVISVGNLHVGGTGKTPVAGWIAGRLRDAGQAPAILSRGYGDDELRLHRRWNPDVPVFADPDRTAAARRAAGAGRSCAVADDAFQHRRLGRRLDLVLLPAEEPWTGPLLPRGPMREPLPALRRADWGVITRRTAPAEAAARAAERLRDAFPGLATARVRLAPDGWATLDGRAAEAPRGAVLAVCGIARPDAFAELVRRGGGVEVETATYPDHHRYGPRDLESLARRARGRTVVTTEKDAVRLADVEGIEALPDVRALRLRVEPEENGEELWAAVVRAVRDRAPRGEEVP